MKNISELIRENSEMISERQAKQRKVNLFIMNCGTINTMLPQIEKYIYQLSPNNIYAFDDKKVEKVKDINKYDWNGPHYNDAKIVDIICSKYLGDNNFVFIP